MIAAPFLLGGAVLAYGISTFLQAHAAERVSVSHSVDPLLLVKFAAQRGYLVGITCQAIAFVLAFFARHELPLFLVQPAVAASLGVTVVLRASVSGWRLRRKDVSALLCLGAGLALLSVAASPSTSDPARTPLFVGLLLAAAAFAVAAVPALRLSGGRGAVVLGGLSGLAYGAAAIGARALASAPSVIGLLTAPTSYAMAVNLLLGVYLFGAALQRGRVTASTAWMYATCTVGPSVVGLFALGDRWRPGYGVITIVGFVATSLAALWSARVVEHQPSVTTTPAHQDVQL